MIELLALPGHRAEPTTLAAWVEQLTARGGPVAVSRESSDTSWVEVAGLRLRGFAMLEGGRVGAINFELDDPDPGPATLAIEAAAQALGWEVHPDDPDDDSDDEDDDGDS